MTIRETSSKTRHVRRFVGGTALLMGVGGMLAGGCIDPESPLIEESTEGCDEFRAGDSVPTSLDVHPKVLRFMQAASDFTREARSIKQDVLTACTEIALDLGASDTWSALEDTDDRLTNGSGTGACDAAGNLIEDAFVDAGVVEAQVAIAVSRGECHLDFDMQAACDAECAANENCDPGSAETRCEPGSLSVMCQGSCEIGAACMGTPEIAANCMGECESSCVGECHGECIDENGQVTIDNPNCNGKCSAACNGTCRGRCKIEQEEGVSCGADVRCTGGCTGEFTQPTCVTEYQPPSCTYDQDCYDACSAKVAQEAECDPTQVDIFADVEATPGIRVVVETLDENLHVLFDSAENEGQLLLDAAGRLGRVGDSLQRRLDDLTGKSLACLGEATTAVAREIGSVDVAVNASVDITVTTTDRMD